MGITDTELSPYEAKLQEWLAKGHHGEMKFMEKHGSKRSRPEELIPGTLRIISVRMNYLPADPNLIKILNDPQKAYISRYAVGRDYHKLMRKRLQRLAEKISNEVGTFGFRAFVDSAPVLEKPIAEKAGLGWQGKNTLILNRHAGHGFFSANYIPIYRCLVINLSPIIVVVVAPVLMYADKSNCRSLSIRCASLHFLFNN